MKLLQPGKLFTLLCGAAAIYLATADQARAVLITSGNVRYEDFQALNASTPAPSGGTGATSPLDPTWNYTNDSFSVTHITNPSNTDYLQTASVTPQLVFGTLHGASQPASALADGLLQQNGDQTSRSVFGNGNNYRIQFSFPENRLVSEVNSYSWHNNTRTIQQYRLYGSAATSSPAVGGANDAALVSAGWTLIATIDSVVLDAEQSGVGSYNENSKHGVSINVGSVNYRHLLMNIQNIGFDATFFGEVDVYTSPVPEPSALALFAFGSIVTWVFRNKRNRQ